MNIFFFIIGFVILWTVFAFVTLYFGERKITPEIMTEKRYKVLHMLFTIFSIMSGIVFSIFLLFVWFWYSRLVRLWPTELLLFLAFLAFAGLVNGIKYILLPKYCKKLALKNLGISYILEALAIATICTSQKILFWRSIIIPLIFFIAGLIFSIRSLQQQIIEFKNLKFGRFS